MVWVALELACSRSEALRSVILRSAEEPSDTPPLEVSPLGYYAAGGAAIGKYVIGPLHRDPEAIEFFRRFLGSLSASFGAK